MGDFRGQLALASQLARLNLEVLEIRRLALFRLRRSCDVLQGSR
jgi:hypothetical protein